MNTDEEEDEKDEEEETSATPRPKTASVTAVYRTAEGSEIKFTRS